MNHLLECYPGDGCLCLTAEILLQVTVVIAAAWAAARTLGGYRAATRHAIWLCALGAVLLSPVTAAVVHRVGIATLPVRLPAQSQPEASPAIATSGPPATVLADDSRFEQSRPEAAAAVAASAEQGRPVGESSSAATAGRSFSMVAWLQASAVAGLAVWAMGVLFLAVRLVCRGRALRRLIREASPAEGERLRGVLDEIRRSLGTAAVPPVLVWRDGAARITPITAGVVRPVIVLSATLVDTLGRDELRDVLVHECAHVLRRDPLVGLLQRAAGIAFWPYPLVRLMNRELTRAREEVCDNYVLQYSDGHRYAHTLFDLAQRVVPLSPRLAQLGLLQPCWRLEDRVAGLLDKRRKTMTRVNYFTGLALAAAFAGVALLASGTRFVQAEPQPAEASQPSEKPAAAASTALPEALTYTGRVTEKGTGKPIAGATVTVRRMILAPGKREVLEEPKYKTNAEGYYTFTIPPEQVAERYLYIELDVSHPGYAPRRGFGYALSMIRKNETIGEKPFFEDVQLYPGEPIWGTIVTPDGKPAAGIKVLGFSIVDRSDFDTMSFTDTKTDAAGGFRLNMADGGDGLFWILPREYSPSTHVLLKKRGDQGTFVLEKGIEMKGRVVGQQGKPVSGVWVNAVVSSGPAKQSYDVPVSEMLCRSALTDAKGEFSLAPLPASTYVVRVDRYPSDSLVEDRAVRIPPDVFGPQLVVLEKGETTKSIEIKALPEVIVEGQFYDSQGKPCSGHAPMLWGCMPGKTLSSPTGFFHVEAKMESPGKFILRAPKGLEKAKLDFITNEHGALRVRLKKDGPLSGKTRDIDVGTLDHDLRGVEVVRYKAPILLVKPLAQDGTLLEGATLQIRYKDFSPFGGSGGWVEGGDVTYERQPDGRLRTEQLLPDEEFTVTVSADGYKSKSETLELPEGAERELEVRLEKVQEGKEAKPHDPSPPTEK